MFTSATTYPIRVSFGRLVSLSVVLHLVSAVPAFALSWVLVPQTATYWPIVFGFPLSVLGIPLTTAFAWLWAKGSNWTNTRLAVLTLVLFPLRIYLMVVALLAGGASYSAVSSITTITRPAAIGVSAALVLLLGWIASRLIALPLAKYIVKRWMPELSGLSTPTTA